MEVLEPSDSVRIEKYDTWPEFIRRSEDNSKPEEEAMSRRHDERGKPWAGTHTYAEALELAQCGWSKGVKLADTQAHELETRLYSLIERPVIEYDLTGEVLDVGRYCSNEPEHWGVFKTELVEGHGTKHISIVVNGAASAGVDTQVIMRRGAAVVALCHLLELAGHRTQVKLAIAVEFKPWYYGIEVPLKTFSESLDMDKLAYAVAHPSCLRRHFFSTAEQTPAKFVEQLHFTRYGSYGRPTETQGDQGDIYLPCMMYSDARWETPEQATDWIKKELVRLKVIKPD